jgi:serine/threonine protein kinase
MPPEVLSNPANGVPFSFSSDIWSAGVTILSCFGYEPKRFLNDRPLELGGILNSLDISEQAKEFLSRMVKDEPEARYTALQCIDHPWIVPEVEEIKEE